MRWPRRIECGGIALWLTLAPPGLGAGPDPSRPALDQAIATHPRDFDARIQRGALHLRQNRPDLALPDFDEAIHLAQANPPHPGLGQAITNRAVALLMLGRADESFAEFERALDTLFRERVLPIGKQGRARTDGMATAHNGLGQVWHQRKDDDKALQEFERAMTLNPASPDGYIGRGVALTGLGRHGEAVASLKVALRLDPNNPRGHGYLGSAFDRMGRDDDALAEYDTALRLDPGSAIMHRLRGALLSRLDRHETALVDFNEAIQREPSNPEAYKDRGGLHNRMGRPDLGLRDLNESLRLKPNNPAALQNRAASYNGLSRFPEALLDADEATHLNPRSLGAWNNRGLALMGLGRDTEAVADLSKAIEIDPRQPAPYLNRGSAFTRLGQADRAMADYDQVARLAPRLALAQQGVGPAHDLLRLRAHSARQFDLPTSPPPDHLARGHALRAEGDLMAAIEEYTKTIQSTPNHPDAHASRGWALFCAGEPGAESDARAWLGLKGWSDPFAPYMALLGALSAREAGRDLAADAFADEALRQLPSPGTWPAPLFEYLKGTRDESSLLLLAANTPRAATEARAVVGLDHLRRNEPNRALDHLLWVRDHGQAPSIARDLAVARLRTFAVARRNEPNPAPAPR